MQELAAGVASISVAVARCPHGSNTKRWRKRCLVFFFFFLHRAVNDLKLL